MPEKYKQTIDQVYEAHKQLFIAFKILHDTYAKDKKKNQQAFNEQGAQVLEILRDAERKLCHGMERGKYASFSAQLASKFWDEVKKTYPLIDFVGAIIE